MFSQNEDCSAVDNWLLLKCECKCVFQEFSKFCKKQHLAESKSLRKYLTWINKKIFSGQNQLHADKSRIENTLQELETKIWISDFADFEEKWLLCEGKATKDFLH